MFSVHPRTRTRLAALNGSGPKLVKLAPPLPYTQFLSLQAGAAAIVTDSGGIQEESTALGIRCFTLRDNTERPVTVTLGTNEVLGLDPRALATIPERLASLARASFPRCGTAAQADAQPARSSDCSTLHRRAPEFGPRLLRAADSRSRPRASRRSKRRPRPREVSHRPDRIARSIARDARVSRGLADISGSGDVDARRLCTTRCSSSSSAGSTTTTAFARTFEGPLSAELRAQGSAPHRRRHVGRVQRALLRAPARAPAGRRGRSTTSPAIVRFSTSRSRATSLRSSRCSGFCCCVSGSLSQERVTLLAVFLPPLTHHSSFPLTDSWGLALEIGAFAAAILAFDRGLKWLPLWIGAIALLGFTRDSAWIPILAVGVVRVPVSLARAGHTLRERRPRRPSGGAALQDARTRATGVAPERSRAVVGHVVGIHRRALSAGAARARSRERRVPPARRVVHALRSSSAVCWRCCWSPGDDRRPAASRPP